MTKQEYEYIQDRLKTKPIDNPYRIIGGNAKKEAYKEGVLACKSILSEIFHQNKKFI